MIRKTREDFITDAKKIHGDKYDYSKVEYINNKTKVVITCKTHGDFKQRPDRHLRGQGCPICRYKKSAKSNQKMSTEEFVKEAKKTHGDKYDYSKVEFSGIHHKVTIICKTHGEFKQSPYHHLKREQGCPIYSESRLEKEISEFLKNKNEKFIREYKTKWLGLQSLDFYLPKYKIGIECQGKQHFGLGGWYNEDFDVIKKRDEKKKKLCEENGVKLFYYSNLDIEYPYDVYENKEKMLKDIKKK